MQDFTAQELSQIFFGSKLTKQEIRQLIYDRYWQIAGDFCLQYGVYYKAGMDIYEKTVQQMCYMMSNGFCEPKEFNRLLKKSLDVQFKREIGFIDKLDNKIESVTDINSHHDMSMLYVINFCKALKNNPQLAEQLNISAEDIAVVYSKFGINVSKSSLNKEKNSIEIAKSVKLTEAEVVARYVKTINKIKAYIRNTVNQESSVNL